MSNVPLSSSWKSSSTSQKYSLPLDERNQDIQELGLGMSFELYGCLERACALTLSNPSQSPLRRPPLRDGAWEFESVSISCSFAAGVVDSLAVMHSQTGYK